jgi:hypothetical protein
MKKFRLLSVVLVMFSALSLTSCDTEPVDPVLNENGQNPGENPGGENPTGEEVFKVDYNGSTHTAMTASAVLGDDLLQIVAVFGANGESMAIGVAATPEVGVYPMNDDILMAYNANANDDSYFNMTNEGSFEITAIDTANKKLSGKFNFKGTGGANGETIIFTNGVFTNIPYTGGAGPVTPEENAFSAKIDGVATDYADDVLGAYASVNDQEYVLITALGDYKITIQADYEIEPGTYAFTNTVQAGMPIATFTADDVQYTNIQGGNLTVTYNDGEHITGSFNFTVKNDAGETIHTVTNGVFDIYY